jgi:exodeoxyribonuclease VII small subunit
MTHTATTPNHEDIAKMSFEQALAELEQIVRKLETGQAELEQSIHDYTRGTALRQHCQQKLEDARLKVESIVVNADGSLSTQAFDAETN